MMIRFYGEIVSKSFHENRQETGPVKKKDSRSTEQTRKQTEKKRVTGIEEI